MPSRAGWGPAALAALTLVAGIAGCVAPPGAPVDACTDSWRVVQRQIVTEASGDERVVPIACMRRIEERRLLVGFNTPPGPDCFKLSGVELVESADAVSVTLRIAPSDDPLAGACPEQPARVATEIDLQAPIEDRALLDGGRRGGEPVPSGSDPDGSPGGTGDGSALP